MQTVDVDVNVECADAETVEWHGCARSNSWAAASAGTVRARASSNEWSRSTLQFEGHDERKQVGQPDGEYRAAAVAVLRFAVVDQQLKEYRGINWRKDEQP